MKVKKPMKLKRSIIASLLGLCIVGSAVAAPPDQDNNRPGPDSQNQAGRPNAPQQQQAPRQGQDRPQQQAPGSQNGRHGGSDHAMQNDRTPRYQQNRPMYRQDMPRPHQNWQRGDRVPQKYRSKGYYVNDWRTRELPPPPSDHRWLRVNGDYVLVGIATGIISQILLGGR